MGPDLEAFLVALWNDGCVEVDCGACFADPAVQPDAVRARLRAADALLRREVHGPAPALSLEVAVHGACLLHAACLALRCHEISTTAVAAALQRHPPPAPPAVAAHSADLTLRYLPDLLAMARSRPGAGLLVDELLRLAREWPLSSVGSGDLGDLDLAPIFAAPALTGRYVDRVLAKRDATRLRDSRLRSAVRAALGAHPELDPWAASALDQSDPS